MLLAIAMSALILVYPRAVAGSVTAINYRMLALLMWGIAIGFIHGVGFIPGSGIWRVVFNPMIGWLLMVSGILLTLSQA